MKAGQIESGPGDQRCQSSDEIEWLKHDMGSAIAKGFVEAIDDLVTFVKRAPLVGDGGAGDVTPEFFFALALMGFADASRVQ
jgi:hypothetical protein